MGAQLTLPLVLDSATTFDTWVVGDNQVLYARSQQVIEASKFDIIYVWGQAHTGRSHFLQACCHAQQRAGQVPMYLSLREQHVSPDILQGLEHTSLLCLDDIDHVAGDAAWEAALFHCYNRCQANQVPWLVTASASAMQVPWGLPDLRTRLGAGEVYQLHALNDEQKCQALQQHCAALGLDLSPEVAMYWLRHSQRDMKSLMEDLRKLDQASWQKQRALTVPFLRSVLAL